MREGRTYRRCTKCGKKVEEKVCQCGNRSTSWSYIVDVAPPGAPRRQKRGGGFETKGKAIEAMNEVQRAHEDGTAVERSKLTVRQYVENWLEDIKPPRSRRGRDPIRPGTWEEWQRRMKNYVLPRVGSIPLQALTEVHLETMYRDLETNGKVRGEGGLARSTVHSIHLTLHAALEDALNRKPVPLVNRNVSDRLYTAPSTPDEEVETWTAEELGTFLASVHDDEHYALWRLAAMTGARRGELLALRWRDVDLDAGTVTINRGRVKGFDGEVESGRTKSERSRRTIDIDPTTIKALTDYRRAQAVASIDGYVFVYASNGKPLHPDGVTQRFEYRVREAGVKHISFKGLRHTHATLLLQGGEPLHVVSRRLGHANEAFTARQYAHVMPGQQADAAARFAAAVDGGAS